MTAKNEFENPTIVNSELSAEELRQILSLQGEILRKAVTRTDFNALLDELCKVAESFTSNSIASIMLYDPERKELRIESAPSLEKQYWAAFNGLRAGDGSCGNAVYHAEPMYVSNTLKDARWKNQVHLAERFGICSCFSFPILSPTGEAIGSFAISSMEPRQPNGFHRALLETCRNICGVILQRRADELLKRDVLEEQIRAKRISSLGVLAGGIAHDFNNLLAAIIGNVDLALTMDPKEDIKESLDFSMKAAESATSLTRQLMMIAKGDNPILAPNNIVDIISESAQLTLRGSNASFELLGAESLESPIFNADGGQLGQLFQNLLLNARQAMPEGGTVRITCADTDHFELPELQPGKYLRLTVADTGRGMSQDTLDHLFEPYYTTRELGSGLGLAVCRSIVENHGGKIHVSSDTKAGTRFTIYLPHSTITHSKKQPEPLPLDRFDILTLVMDDDELVRTSVCRLLRQLGCRVVETKDGREALERLVAASENGEQIDLAILDLTVPGGMGGMETKELIRKEHPLVKLIVSSGYSAGEASIHDHKQAGFDAAIHKPYRIEDMKRELTKLFPPSET